MAAEHVVELITRWDAVQNWTFWHSDFLYYYDQYCLYYYYCYLNHVDNFIYLTFS